MTRHAACGQENSHLESELASIPRTRVQPRPPVSWPLYVMNACAPSRQPGLQPSARGGVGQRALSLHHSTPQGCDLRGAPRWQCAASTYPARPQVGTNGRTHRGSNQGYTALSYSLPALACVPPLTQRPDAGWPWQAQAHSRNLGGPWWLMAALPPKRMPCFTQRCHPLGRGLAACATARPLA